MIERVRLCGVDEMEPSSARRFDVFPYQIALVRIADDFYAVSDICSHEDYSLSEGEILADEREIECWKHGSTFSLTTGDPSCLPATHPIPVYAVEVDDGSVYVLVDK